MDFLSVMNWPIEKYPMFSLMTNSNENTTIEISNNTYSVNISTECKKNKCKLYITIQISMLKPTNISKHKTNFD